MTGECSKIAHIFFFKDGYQATDVYYKWNSRNSTGDVVYIAEDLEMPQFMITNVELEEKTNIYNIGTQISAFNWMRTSLDSHLFQIFDFNKSLFQIY